MKLIVGGAFQGKRDFALGLAKGRTPLVADGEKDSLEAALRCGILCGFQGYVRRFFMGEDDGDQRLLEFIHRLNTENPDVIVTADELGCGIVPVEKNDRIWRERSGDGCRLLASLSDEVYRVVCGLPVLLKGEGPKGEGLKAEGQKGEVR